MADAVYVVNTASLSTLPLKTTIDGVSEGLRAVEPAALDEVERPVSDAVPLERVTREESPAKGIGEYATTADSDLIVMGTHGRSGVDRPLLGSVAGRGVRRLRVPVLTNRERIGERRDAPPD